MNIKTFKFIALLMVFNTSLASAQISEKDSGETEKELRPFTSQTNYMSLPGYLRHQSYLETREWRSIKQFQLGYSNIRVLLSSSIITVDFGNLGQIGDADAMNSWGISLVSQNIRSFPKINKYSILWSSYFSVGEGQYTSLYNYAIVYDRIKRTLEDINGKKYNVTDADVLATDRKNDALLRK